MVQCAGSIIQWLNSGFSVPATKYHQTQCPGSKFRFNLLDLSNILWQAYSVQSCCVYEHQYLLPVVNCLHWYLFNTRVKTMNDGNLDPVFAIYLITFRFHTNSVWWEFYVNIGKYSTYNRFISHNIYKTFHLVLIKLKAHKSLL